MRHSQRKVRVVRILIAAAVCAAGLPAVVAAAPPISVRQANGSAFPLSLMMEDNGGSLFRAQEAYRYANAQPSDQDQANAPPPGSLAAVSFFAVAAPQPKVYKKHDLVTIIAQEDSSFTSNGNETLTKTQDFDSQLNSFIAFRPSNLQLHSIISGGSNFPEIKNQNERDYKGTGEVDRTDTLSDRVTAEVVDVKPNGTLVLQAIKQIQTDEEMQRMVLTGICRAQDITADNTVLSTQLYDLELQQIHTGAVNDTTRRGFLPRLLDQFSPF
jgi:flagellar L-ring protein FlgH